MRNLRLIFLFAFLAAWVGSAFAFLPRGLVGSSPSGTVVQWYANDMGANGTLGVTQLLDQSTGAKGTLWLAWQTLRTVNGVTNKYPECATQNLDTGVYNGPYICGEAVIDPYGLEDEHGQPSMVMDASGHMFVFYGGIVSPVQIASTANPRDPSSWTQQTPYAGVTGYTIFSQPRFISGSIFNMYTGGPFGTQGSPSGESQGYYVKMTSSAGGVPTWGTPQNYYDFSAVGTWTFTPNFQVVGTKIYASSVPYNVITGVIGDVYFYILDTANGNLSNFDGSFVVGPGSQPIDFATYQAHFRVVTVRPTNYNGVGPFWYDSVNNVAHLIYSQAPCVDETCAVDLKYVNLSLSGGHTVVSSPQTIYTWSATSPGVSVTQSRFGLGPNQAGGILAIFPDGTYPPGLFHYQGNMVGLNRSAGGTWDVSPTILDTRTGAGFNSTPNIASAQTWALAPAAAQFATQEATASENGFYGIIHGYIHKDATTVIPITLLAPSVSSVSPSSGGANTPVTVSGTNMGFASNIKFGTLDAKFACFSPTSCTAYAPTASAGSVTVTVMTPAGTSSNSVNFTNNSTPPSPSADLPPQILLVNVSNGLSAGGTPVTLSGANFSGATAVHFGSSTALFSVDSDGSIFTITPAGSGVVNITVTTPAGTSTVYGQSLFQYYTPTQYYWSASGNDANVPCTSAVSPCRTMALFNAATFTGDAQVNFTGTYTTGDCLAIGSNISGTTTFYLDGHGTTTQTPDASNSTCAPMAGNAQQQNGGITLTNSNVGSNAVRVCNWTMHGNGGSTMFGIFDGGNGATLCNNSVNGFYCVGSPYCGFWGADIYVQAAYQHNILDNATIGQSGVTSKDDTGIIAGFNSGVGPQQLSGNTIANIGVNERPGDHIPSSGSGVQSNSGSFAVWEYNVSHDIGGNSLGGPSAFLFGGSYSVVQRNEAYNTRPYLPTYAGTGSDWDGIDCADEGAAPQNLCKQNYTHGNFGAGVLHFATSHGIPPAGEWGFNSILYNISENDVQEISDGTNGAINLTGIAECSTFGCCGEVGPSDIFNNTVLYDPLASIYGHRAAAYSNSQCEGVPGITANNLFAVATNDSGDSIMFTSNSLDTPNRTYAGNGYFAIGGRPLWYQVGGGGSYATLSGWQGALAAGAGLGGDVGAVAETSSVSFTGSVSGTNLTASSVSGTISNGLVLKSLGSVAAATVATGGSGYSNGALTLQVDTGNCSDPPKVNVTVVAGIVTSVTSVADPGVCLINPDSPTSTVPLSGLSGSGATLNITAIPPIPAGTTIVSGGPGGAGVYVISNSTTISSASMVGMIPVFANAAYAGACVWTPVSTGPGPQGFSSCPSNYELASGSIAYGSGVALDRAPFSIFTPQTPGPQVSPIINFGIGTQDYYLNDNNAGVVTKPHCIGAFDGSCGTNSTPPTVVVTAPSAGTVSGTLNLTASCTPASGLCQTLTYTIGGIPSFTPTVTNISPYTASWDSTSMEDGTYDVVATAIDSSGNMGTSSPVSVTISNGAVSCSQATALLGRGYTGAAYPITRLLCKGIAQGYGALVDAGYMAVGNDSASSLMNVYQNAYNGTVNSGGGISSLAPNGVSAFYGGYVDTHLNPSTAMGLNYTQNSASILDYILPNPDLPADGLGFPNLEGHITGPSMQNPDFSTSLTYIYPRYIGDGEFFAPINDIASASGPGVAVSTPFGFFAGVRTNSTTTKLLYNGTLLQTNTSSSAAPGNANFRLPMPYFTLNNAVTLIGGSMTNAQVAAACHDVLIFVWAQTGGKTIGPPC